MQEANIYDSPNKGTTNNVIFLLFAGNLLTVMWSKR